MAIDKVTSNPYDEIQEGLEIIKMQIRKTYKSVNPELLFSEIKDFTLKQGAVVNDSKMETFSSPNDSSSFISRGTLTFSVPNKTGKGNNSGLSVHIVGSAKDETKLIMDVDEKLFPKDKLAALQDDLDFIFSSYEVKSA